MTESTTSLNRCYRGARLAAAAAALLIMFGCGKNKDIDQPAELTDLEPTREVDRLWKVGLDNDSDRLRLALKPVLGDGVVYAASHEGEVVAIKANTGKRIWRKKTKLALSAGPEVAEGLLLLGSSDGDIIALDVTNGAERWRKSIAAEILAQPLVVNDTVVVRTVDGHLEGLALADGTKRWAVDEQVPRLTLRGTAPPVLAGDRVIAGFDSGKVLAIDPRNGDVLWDSIVNAPRGRTELERLADIDSPARIAGDDVFVVGFQGRIAMLARDSGQIWWARDASSYRGFAMDEQNLYLTSADSVVTAMRRTDGAVLWEQNVLKRRGLTAPAIDGDMLVVGDYKGFVHWLDKSTGALLARHKTDGERITNSVVASDSRVFVQTDSGKLLAFRTTPRETKADRAKPDEAKPEPTPPVDTPPPAPSGS